MFSNKLAFTVLGAACITAAGAGSYVALRQNATSSASAKPIQAVITQPSSAATAAFNRPVQETEAIVTHTSSPKVSAGPVAARTGSAEESAAVRRETKPAQVHADPA